MTPKQRRFVEEYLVDRNAAAAARRVGDEPKFACQRGWRMLHNPKVRVAIAAAAREREERTGISRDRVLRELARIAFASAGEYLDWGPDGVALKNKSVLTPDQQAAVAEITQRRTKTSDTVRFKLYDKLAALKELSRLLGYAGETLDAADAEVGELSDTERVQRVLALFERAAREQESEGAETGAGDGCRDGCREA